MWVNYGYRDGLGDWFLTIDTDKCDGCAECVEVCPGQVLEVVVDGYDEAVAVKEEARKSLKYLCDPCAANRPCQSACVQGALEFSW